jgi:hypothetical protein
VQPGAVAERVANLATLINQRFTANTAAKTGTPERSIGRYATRAKARANLENRISASILANHLAKTGMNSTVNRELVERFAPDVKAIRVRKSCRIPIGCRPPDRSLRQPADELTRQHRAKDCLDRHIVSKHLLERIARQSGICVLIGVGSRRRSASQALDLPRNGGVNLVRRRFTARPRRGRRVGGQNLPAGGRDTNTSRPAQSIKWPAVLLVAVLLGTMILGEPFSASIAVGTCLVIVSIIGMWVAEHSPAISRRQGTSRPRRARNICLAFTGGYRRRCLTPVPVEIYAGAAGGVIPFRCNPTTKT